MGTQICCALWNMPWDMEGLSDGTHWRRLLSKLQGRKMRMFSSVGKNGQTFTYLVG